MTRIPKDVQDFIEGKTAWVATATADGIPNATPKGSIKVLDDEHVVFADLFSLKTRANLMENPKVAVIAVDEATYKGYQIKGIAEVLDCGPLFDRMVEELKKVPKQFPKLSYAVRIKVESVYDQSVGPNAGIQIA